jgi:hypothetical protein
MRKSSVFVLAACLSCAHSPANPEVPIVLPEAASGPVAEIIKELTGQKPYGVTLPGLPPVYFVQNPSKCLKVHEQTHVQQQKAADANNTGGFVWGSRYAAQLVACTTAAPLSERRAAFTACLKTIPLEKEAYDAQHACEAAEH